MAEPPQSTEGTTVKADATILPAEDDAERRLSPLPARLPAPIFQEATPG